MPRFWGSETRVVQPKGIWNGFAEGGKGFAYGLADGIGGLVTKPLKGAKEDVSLTRSDTHRKDLLELINDRLS